MDGRRDGSEKVKKAGGLNPQAFAMPSVLPFLWRLYHSVGEDTPDRFAFERYDVTTLTVRPVGVPTVSPGSPQDGHPRKQPTDLAATPLAPEEEEQERATVGSALYAETRRLPAAAVQAGPGMPQGP